MNVTRLQRGFYFAFVRQSAVNYCMVTTNTDDTVLFHHGHR